MAESLGRNSDSEKPVPPPNFWTKACAREALVIPSIVSSSGKTKHADKVP